MDKHTYLFVFVVLCCICLPSKAQVYSLDDLLLRNQSTPESAVLESEKEINEYDNRLFKIQVLPKLQMSATLPSLTNSISPITLGDGSEKFVNRYYMNTAVSMGLSQLIPFTGGTVTVSTGLTRLDNFSPQRNKSFNFNMFNVSYAQSIASFNQYKWDKKILSKQNEAFDIAQIQERERINLSIIELFFDLLAAQKEEELNQLMADNAGLLNEKAKALYSQGRISKSELLNTEVAIRRYNCSIVQAEKARCQNKLVSKLDLDESSPVVSFNFDDLENIHVLIDEDFIIERVERYSAEISRDVERLKEDCEIKKLKSSGLPSFSVSLGGGFNSHDEEFRHLTNAPSRNFSAVVSVGIPILTWGENKTRVKRLMAQKQINELQHESSLNELRASCKYDLECIVLLVESFKTQKNTLHVLYTQLQELTDQYDAGRINYTRIQDVQSEIIHVELSRIENAKRIMQIKYKYRVLALFDVFENCSIQNR